MKADLSPHGTLRTWMERPIFWAALCLPFFAFAVYEAKELWRIIGTEYTAIGVDLEFYREMGRRWLETGTFYTERQLAGHYETTTLIDNLYPPHAILLFVPFVFLPWFLWWAIPLTVIAYVVWRLRPAPWSWPLLMILIAFPKTISATIYGNSDLWVGAFIAGAVWWGWPGTLVTIKPSLLPFALLGLRRRSWWVASLALAAVSLPLLPLWLQYPTVMLNSSSSLTYSVLNLPFLSLPVVAWLCSPTHRPRLPERGRTALRGTVDGLRARG